MVKCSRRQCQDRLDVRHRGVATTETCNTVRSQRRGPDTTKSFRPVIGQVSSPRERLSRTMVWPTVQVEACSARDAHVVNGGTCRTRRRPRRHAMGRVCFLVSS